MRPYGGVKKVSQKGVGQKYIGYVHALQGWNVNRGSLWHTVGIKELKLLEGYCHSKPRYLYQGLLFKVSWFSESGHLVLARSKISHIRAGLGLQSSDRGGWAKNLSRSIVLRAPTRLKSGEWLREGGGARIIKRGTVMMVLMYVLNNVWWSKTKTKTNLTIMIVENLDNRSCGCWFVKGKILVSWNALWSQRLYAQMIMGFWLVKESQVVKDKQIGFIWLDRGVRGRYSKKHL